MKRSAILLASLIITPIIWVSGCAVPGVKGRVIDKYNKGIAGVFIVYGYKGLEYKIVCSESYYHPGTMVRTDDEGFFELPGMIHFYAPFLKSNLSLEIYVIYDPHTHCVGTLPDNVRYYYRSYSRDGLSEFKKAYPCLTYKQEGDLETLIFRDVTENPIAWFNSINRLSGAVRIYGSNSWDASNEDKQAFLAYFLREYEEFQRHYGQEQCLEGHNKGRTWNEVLSDDVKHTLKWYTERLFDRPDYRHSQSDKDYKSYKPQGGEKK